MNISMFQMNIAWENKEANIKKIEKAAGQAKKLGANIVCVPETFTTGFSMNPKKDSEDFSKSSTLRELSKISRTNRIHILGSITEKKGKKQFNTAVVFSPSGKLIATYRKIHLFPLSKEHKRYSSGNKAVLFKINGITCGIAICYDLRFPELFRALEQKGAKIIFVPANWPSIREMHWTTLLRARAIENQVYVIGINRTGKDLHSHYNGKSVVFDPWGEELHCKWISNELSYPIGIDLKKLEKIRKEYPFLRSTRKKFSCAF